MGDYQLISMADVKAIVLKLYVIQFWPMIFCVIFPDISAQTAYQTECKTRSQVKE